MYVSLRRALGIAALFGIAGCSGGSTSQSPSLPSQSTSAFVHRGVPFIPTALRRGVSLHSIRANYATNASLVFEADQEEAAVNIYQTADLTSNPAPIATIHVAAGCPYGMATDKKGKTLYVVDNCGGNDVEEYAKGSTTLKTTITDGVSNPLGAAVDKHGTLYVSNYPAAITEYAKGTSTPLKTITGGGMVDPFGLALDKSGNLYIADFGNGGAVFELPAGGSSVTNLNLSGIGEPIGLAIDEKTGYLWETGGSDNIINVYQLGGSTSPIETFTGNGDPYALSLQEKGKPKDEVVESDVSSDAVYAYAPGSYTPYATLTNGVELPTGLLIVKP
jgi:DNA-binding beta-propeller fold protein YncE